MARTRKKKCTLPQVLEAVERAKTRSGAARLLGVKAMTVWRYSKRWRQMEEALYEKRLELVHLAEVGLRHAVEREEPWAIAFTLKTLGKDMGYTERVERAGTDGRPVQIEVVYVNRNPPRDD